MSEGGVVVLDGSAEALLLQVRALGTDAQGRSVPVCAGCNGPFVDDHFVHASWCPYYEPEPTTWWRSARKVIFGILVVAGAVFLCILVIGGVAG